MNIKWVSINFYLEEYDVKNDKIIPLKPDWFRNLLAFILRQTIWRKHNVKNSYGKRSGD